MCVWSCLLLKAERNASFYERGKTILRYDENLGSAPLAPSSREIIYGPMHSESSQSSEGSQETGDSGHYSSEDSNEEMSNPSTSRSSRPESIGSNDGIAVSELKQSLEVENEKMLSRALHYSAPGDSLLCCTLEGSHPDLHTSQAASSWPSQANVCSSAARTTPFLSRLILSSWVPPLLPEAQRICRATA